MKLTIGITAGGRSSRFGEDKRFLRYQGRTFLDHALHTFQDAEEVILALEEESPVSVEQNNLKIVYDAKKNIGPMEALHQILLSASHDYVFVFPVDMPLVTKALVTFLSSYIEEGIDAICPVVEGRTYPLCAIYRKAILPQLETLEKEENYRLKSLLETIRTKYVDFTYTTFSPKTFWNINRKEDYEKLLYPIVFAVSGYKKTGKTTLMEDLLLRFQKDGYAVGAIKHDGHEYEMDKAGTDSDRFFQTGADTAIYSGSKATLLLHGEKSLEEMISFFHDKEIILIEGAKDSPLPKIQLTKEEEEAFPEVFLRLEGTYDAEEVYEKTKAYFGLRGKRR